MNLHTHKQYRVDINGSSKENYVGLDILTRGEFGEGNVLVPTYAPFFRDSMRLVHPNGVELEYGTEYRFIEIDERFTGPCAKPVSIFILLLKDSIKTVHASYHTLGTLPLFNKGIMSMCDIAYNDDRDVWFDDISEKPSLYTPKLHHHDFNIDLYSFELLIQTVETRYDLIYKNFNSSIHEDFFLTQINNLKSYLTTFKDMITELQNNHINNSQDPHGVNSKDVEGLDKVENVKTATLKETLAGESDKLRIVPGNASKYISKNMVDSSKGVNITGLTNQNVRSETGLNNINKFDNVKSFTGLRSANVIMFIGLDGKGWGIGEGYGDNGENRLVILNNNNPLDEDCVPFENKWEVTQHPFVPPNGVELDFVTPSFSTRYMIMGSEKSKSLYLYERNEIKGGYENINMTDVKSYPLTVPKELATYIFDKEKRNDLIFLINPTGIFIIYPGNGTKYGYLSFWCIYGNNFVDISNVFIYDKNGKNRLTNYSDNDDPDFFDRVIDYQGKSKGMISTFTTALPYDDSYLKMVNVYKETGDTSAYSKGFQKHWFLVGEKFTINNQKVVIPSLISFRLQLVGRVIYITEIDGGKSLTLNSDGTLADDSVTKFPVELLQRDSSLVTIGRDLKTLVYNKKGTGLCYKTFKTLFLDTASPYTTVVNYTTLPIFTYPNLFKTKRDKNNLMTFTTHETLGFRNWDKIGVYPTAYSESDYLGGSAIFKYKKKDGHYQYVVKSLPSKMTFTKGSNPNLNEYLLPPNNTYFTIMGLPHDQFKLGMYYKKNGKIETRSTSFAATSSVNATIKGNNYLAPLNYGINENKEFYYLNHYLVNEIFINTLLGEDINGSTKWTILFTNDENIMKNNMLFVHYMKNNKLCTRIVSFKLPSAKLPYVLVDGIKAMVLNNKTEINVISDIVITSATTYDTNIVDDNIIYFKENGESGNGTIVLNRQTGKSDSTLLFFNSFYSLLVDGVITPISYIFDINTIGGITKKSEINISETNVGYYYHSTLEWCRSLPYSFENNPSNNLQCEVLDPTYDGIVKGKIISGNTIYSLLDRNSEVGFFIYILDKLTVMMNGKNILIKPSVINIQNYYPNCNNKVLYIYLRMVNNTIDFEFNERMFDSDSAKLIGKVITDNEKVTEVSSY